MPSKKKKYNARFPAGRIKKIMQSDEEVGKVAQAVPIIISRTLELFVESLLTKTLRITNARNAKTLSPSHMKQCIMAESRFDFLRDIVKNVPDINIEEQLMNPHGQSYAAGSEPDDDPTPTLTYVPVTTARDARSSAPTTPIQPSTSSYSGVFAPIDGHRNGLKRSMSSAPQPTYTAHPQYYETGGRPTNPMMMHKQQSLDLSLSTGAKNCTTIPAANYYTEITSDDPMPPLGVRPAKMSRTNSHPVTVTSSHRTDANTAQLHSAPATPAAPPVINFDMRNGVATTFQYSPIVPNHLPASSSDPTPTTFSGAIDVCNSPLVKIDYSQMDFSPPTCSTSVPTSTRRTAATPTTPGPAIAYTKVPAPRGRPPKNRTATTTSSSATTTQPVLTFDFTNLSSGPSSSKTQPSTSRGSGSTAVASSSSQSNGTPRFELAPFVPATSTCLDMDEDYDDI